jgi:Rrf2 family iron-sulfur cluster assembly transcriptional regulator
MRITQWGEYGVHCAVFIAREEANGSLGSISAAQIAAEFNIQTDYAQQILQRLRKGGIIESVRGPNGGYRLARTSAEITLGDILVACEGEVFQALCNTKPIDEHRCGEGTSCGLRDLWGELREHLDIFFRSHRLSDLVPRLSDPKLVQLKRTKNSG